MVRTVRMPQAYLKNGLAIGAAMTTSAAFHDYAGGEAPLKRPYNGMAACRVPTEAEAAAAGLRGALRGGGGGSGSGGSSGGSGSHDGDGNAVVAGEACLGAACACRASTRAMCNTTCSTGCSEACWIAQFDPSGSGDGINSIDKDEYATSDGDWPVSPRFVEVGGDMAYFSSMGPTSTGRIKPDLVAPGYYIASAHSTGSLLTYMLH